MIQIVLGNSHSRIIGLPDKEFKKLRDQLSYLKNPDQAYFGKGFVNRSYLLTKSGDFPSGLLHRIETFLKLCSLMYTLKDTRIKPPAQPPLRGYKGPQPYAEQETAVEMALKHGQGCISMPTGTGKSLVIALIASRLNLNTLVVVPSLEIKKQLIGDFRAFYGHTPKVRIENIDSAVLSTLKGFDCLIIDEAHHSAAKTYQKLNKTAWAGIYYRFFVTATPFRNQKEETLLFEGIAGKVIYQLSYKTAIAKGLIVPVQAYYIEMPKYDTDAYTWREVYDECVVNNAHRNSKISELLVNLEEAGSPTLCLVREVAHGDKLRLMSNIPFVSGQDEESRAYIKEFNAKEIPCLIGTTGVLGEGVDTKPCEFVIIAGLGKAKSAFMQQVGRAVRRYPGKEAATVILIKDRSHKFLLRHFNAQAKILKEEYGVTLQKLEL